MTRALFTPVALSQYTAERDGVQSGYKPQWIFEGGSVLKDLTGSLPWGQKTWSHMVTRVLTLFFSHAHARTHKNMSLPNSLSSFIFVQISGNTVAERQEMCFATSG